MSGKKIFISYKYADNAVRVLPGSMFESTVRDYVNIIQDEIGQTEHIFKAEKDNEDLSYLEENTIWEKLKRRIYDSSVTIVMISPNMRNRFQLDKSQWIPWEVRYSLTEYSRLDQNGNPRTSHSNALLGIVLPDRNGSYSYFINHHSCCPEKCIQYNTDFLFNILRQNMFNHKFLHPNTCLTGTSLWPANASYFYCVEWDNFIGHMQAHITAACERQNNISSYDIEKNI